MYIFTYRWPDSGLTADEVTEIKTNIANRTLVLFQNFPLSQADSFPGGEFNASAADATRGCYAYSAEEGVMDRSDWAVYPLGDTPCGQVIGIFGNMIVNIDSTADTDDSYTTAMETYINNEEKIIAIIGNLDKDLTPTGFLDVTQESATSTFIKTKPGYTATVAAYAYHYGDSTKTPVDIEFTAV